MWRKPDEVIGEEGVPYLLRWWLFKSAFLCVYLHKFLHSDSDRALHDHPAPSLSFLLGDYLEIILDEPNGVRRIVRRKQFNFVYRKATHIHRIVLYSDRNKKPIPVYTLFLFFGSKRRNWGFWCNDERFVPWQQFCDERDHGKIGRGCD